jgi:hypothetical protein
MRKLKALSFICLGLLRSMLPQAMADNWDQKTIFTFSGLAADGLRAVSSPDFASRQGQLHSEREASSAPSDSACSLAQARVG